MSINNISNSYKVALFIFSCGLVIGAMGAFSIYPLAHMSTKLVVLSLCVAQLAMNYIIGEKAKMRVLIPRDPLTPDESPQDSPGRKQHNESPLRVSQQLEGQ